MNPSLFFASQLISERSNDTFSLAFEVTEDDSSRKQFFKRHFLLDL